MRAIKTLIVDDSAVFRESLRLPLEASRHIRVVGEAEDGEEAIRKVDELVPDVVLMDISMPRMNGLEATRAIKAGHPTTSILILSVHDDDESRHEAERVLADGYLVKKEVSLDRVTREIERIVRRRHA